MEQIMNAKQSIKGVLLAGGTGSRLYPTTKVTNKHLLPIYNNPMIYYPLETLINMGIKEILVVSGTEHCGHILQLLGSGKHLGVDISYRVQDEAGGIAQALGLAESFACGSKVAVILGDNIFVDNFNIDDFDDGARIYLKKTSTPERFGIANFFQDKLVSIVEKPKQFISDLAVTGLYLYDNLVFDFIRNIKPSERNELEITDINNIYIREQKISYEIVKNDWTDAGTFESLYIANQIARNKFQMENK
jgi:glucose-1-phosphate thymidylyltransferase